MTRPNFLLLLTSALACGSVSPVAGAREGPAALSGSRSGIDEAAMDRTVAPGDDFYAYANGAWSRSVAIPHDDSFFSRTSPLRASTAERVLQIVKRTATLQNPPGSPDERIETLFNSYMDLAAIEKAGASPLEPHLAAIDAVTTRDQLAAAFATADRQGVVVPVSLFVQQDLKDNAVNAAYVQQSGLGLPDREYYLSNDPDAVSVRAKYRLYLATLLRLAGRDRPDEAADRVLAVETALAAVHWTAAASRDVSRLYNPEATRSFGEFAPGIRWQSLFAAAGLKGEERLIVFQPDAIAAEAKIVEATPMQDWRDYLAAHTVALAAPYLSKEFVDADFAMNGMALWGAQVAPSREKRAAAMIGQAMGQAVGRLYVAQYFPPAAKAQADDLVRNLIVAMDARLARLDWLEPRTKTRARAKLASMIPKIGYPERWPDYAGLRIVRGDVLGNFLRAQTFERDRRLARLGHAVDRAEWSMTPQTVNAYASAPANDVVFPAAILQPPYFDAARDAAANYGALGAVIGHEISHNFDDRGSRFDAHGELNPWWSEHDAKRFRAAGERLVSQFGAYEPIPGVRIDGRLTLSENMADLAGVTIAYDAYHASMHGRPAPVIGGLTGDQRFFLAYAQLFATRYRDEALRGQLKNNPHSPSPWRVAVVRNLGAWHDAFGVRPGQQQYLAPEQRISIW